MRPWLLISFCSLAACRSGFDPHLDSTPGRPLDAPTAERDVPTPAEARSAERKGPDTTRPDLKRSDGPKAIDANPKDLAKSLDKRLVDVPTCPSGFCWAGTGCVVGSADSACGNGSACVDCAASGRVCVSFACQCTGCVQPGGTCVPAGWINAPNCGLAGAACVNCNTMRPAMRCDVVTGSCVPKPDAAQ